MPLKATVFEYAKLSSAHFIFLTAIVPVTGAIAMGEKNLFLLTVVFLIGLTAHIVGFALNHYRDVEVDRLIYQVNRRPLPSGTITKKHALFYILTVFFFGCIMTVVFYGLVLLLLYLFGIFLASLYDLYSKKISGMDFILAAAVTTALVFGAATVSFQFSTLLYILCVLAFLQTLNLNLIAGGIKDADHDYLVKSQHLSTRLGVRVEQGVLCIPKSFKIIAYLLAFLYTFFVLAPVIYGVIALESVLVIILFLISILFFFVTFKMLQLTTFDRQEIRKYVVLQYTINWSNVPILLMSTAPWAGLMILYPIIGLIVSNLFLYRTVVRSQVM